jgi:hypothetical protein
MPIVLSPYKPDATCPKCGGKDVSTAYRETDLVWSCLYHHERIGGEHFDRTCRTCGYVWAEACLGKDEVLHRDTT